MSTKNGNFLVLLDFLMRWEKTVFSEVSGIAVIYSFGNCSILDFLKKIIVFLFILYVDLFSTVLFCGQFLEEPTLSVQLKAAD